MMILNTSAKYIYTLVACIGSMVLFAQNQGGERCSQALEIPVSLTSSCDLGLVVGENTIIALPANIDPPCDQAGVNRDLWYSFIAPDNGEIQINITLGTASRVEAAIFRVCGNINFPTNVFCTSSNADGEIIKDLQIGKRYYIQLWSDELAVGTFDFCLSGTGVAYPNDACDFAKPLNYSTSPSPCDTGGVYKYLEDNFGATANMNNGIPSCSNFGEGKDVWFSFITPPNGDIYIEMSYAGGPNDWAMALYSGGCAGLNEIACDDDSGPGLFPAIEKKGLTAGEELLIRVWEYGGDDHGKFYISLLNPVPVLPENDLCSSATVLTVISAGSGDCSDGQLCGFNVNASPSGELPSPSCSKFGIGIDTWYQLRVPPGGDVRIELSPQNPRGSQDWAMAAYRGICGDLEEIDCDDDSGIGYFPLIDLQNLSYKQRIYIRVWDYASNEEGSYNICASTTGALPVVFQDISAVAMGDVNSIQWIVDEEFGTEMHQLQVSYEGNFDQWLTIANISPQMNAVTPLKYEYVDSNPQRISYYRVRIVNLDGTTEYSKIVSVIRKPVLSSSGKLNVYPNPVIDQLIIAIDGQLVSETDMIMEVWNIKGQRILLRKVRKKKGELSFTQDVSELPEGQMYLLRMVANGQVFQTRFIK